MLSITPAVKSDITHIVCPHCKEKLARVGLHKSKLNSLCGCTVNIVLCQSPERQSPIRQRWRWGFFVSQKS